MASLEPLCLAKDLGALGHLGKVINLYSHALTCYVSLSFDLQITGFL